MACKIGLHLVFDLDTLDTLGTLDTTTTLSDSSIVVHDLVLHSAIWASCACSGLVHLQLIGTL